MGKSIHISFNAEDRSYLAILKKEIHVLVSTAGFSESKTGEVDIIVAEMASNLIKHAGGGEILVNISGEGDDTVVELISIDNGPGIVDPIRMMEDGMSTSNTLGHGLGAMKRLSDVFQIYSMKDWGTIVLSRIYKTECPVNVKKPQFEINSIIVAKPGEAVSGDGASYQLKPNCLQVLLGDGLGHGVDANAAVQKAISFFDKCSEDRPTDILRLLHTEVKKTRGLVGTVATYYFKEKKWHICGIGNISTKVQNSVTSRNCMSYNGIIGMNIPNSLKEQEVENLRGQIIIMCSDGIKTRWETQKFIGISKYDLSILAAAIYKDFARKTDDMSVVVGRINSLS